MERFIVLATSVFLSVLVGSTGQYFYDQAALQRQYDAGDQAGYDRGVNAWPELRAEFKKTNVCQWSEYMLLSPTCRNQTVIH